MLKIAPSELAKREKDHPGTVSSIKYFEEMRLPKCPKCKSANTALVQAGIIGRTIALCSATTKFHLTPNGGPGKYFCNDCGKFFDSQSEPAKESQRYSQVVFGGMQKGESFDDFKSRFLQRLKQVGWFQKSSQSSSLPQTQPQKRDPRDQETIDYLANELAQAKPVS
jgi:hypothetical protein